MTLVLPAPYLLYLGDIPTERYAKTACGLRDWAGEKCVGQFRHSDETVDIGLPDMRPAEAVAAGARSLIIGVANAGGRIADHWIGDIKEALHAGLDVVSGMHMWLETLPGVAEAAEAAGRQLIDVRRVRENPPLGRGVKRSGKRLLTIGTDCAVGKKYTALSLARALRVRGLSATFRATGQTGIMIASEGVPMDAIVADFVSGAAEALSPDNDADHWDVIEGQGTLFHPAYAAVSLGLLHGSQPDAVVLCHDPTRSEISGFPGFPIPSLEQAIAHYVDAGRVTNTAIRCVGVSINTSQLSDGARASLLTETEQRLGLPCVDPMISDLSPVLEQLERL